MTVDQGLTNAEVVNILAAETEAEEEEEEHTKLQWIRLRVLLLAGYFFLIL